MRIARLAKHDEGPELAIERMGNDGDGIATLPDGERAFFPFALPGERVRILGKRRAEVLLASPDRTAPPCPHFGVCGGCSLQHWRDDAYLAWKTGLLAEALRRAGYPNAPMRPIARTPPHARRRLDLAIRRRGGAITIGLHAARDDAVIDLRACDVLYPSLFALIDPVRTLLAQLSAPRRQGSLIANLLDNGPDLLLRADADFTAADRARIAEFAREHGIARVSIAGMRGAPETACLLRTPMVSFGGASLTPPPGAFMQASREGESAIVDAVLSEARSSRHIAEFYAGCGTLTFALAQQARVTAYEGDAGAVAALRSAANAAGLAGRIEVRHRDLTRQPVRADALSKAEAVVLDPPHAGAAAQVAEIAASKVRRVVYVSCNPATLARDAVLLRAAGFDVVSALPVDQFLWSARLESVVAFAR
jgi:23S rRNA (uracil1939-C5)-methyltransferase